MIVLGSQLNYEETSKFNLLLDKVVRELSESQPEPGQLTPKGFEQLTYDTIQRVQQGCISESFAAWPVHLISGSRFPDIVLDIEKSRKFGVEVKTSKQSSWKTLGGSINESTRIEGVERIKVLFAQTNPFEVQHRNFEDCVSDVVVTHSPRYVIDFNVAPTDTLFKQVGVTYDEVWRSEKPFDLFRTHFLEKAQAQNTDLWFMDTTDADPDDLPKVTIKFFNSLPRGEQENLIHRTLLLFPEIFKKNADYAAVALWLLKRGILNTSLRDTYSAGKRIAIYGHNVPRKYYRLQRSLPHLKALAQRPHLNTELAERYESNDPSVILQTWANSVIGASPAEFRACVEQILSEHI